MKKAVILGFFLSQTLFTFAWGANVIPENSLKQPLIKPKSLESSNVTEADFNEVINTLHRIYAPVVKKKANVELVMKADWHSGVVNAYATREVDTWSVHIAGGIARSKGMTKDSLALVVCHELGHHLGGAPRTFLFDGWPSAEGQADYWASSKCLKKYYAEVEMIEDIAQDENLPEKVLADCRNTYQSTVRMNICLRSMLATVHFSNFLNTLPTSRWITSITGKDNRVVKGTNTNDYPRPQCRIDTLYQGSLCTVDANAETSETNRLLGHCNEGEVGTRPICWYRP
jgi:hypothetical protein